MNKQNELSTGAYSVTGLKYYQQKGDFETAEIIWRKLVQEALRDTICEPYIRDIFRTAGMGEITVDTQARTACWIVPFPGFIKEYTFTAQGLSCKIN